MTVFAEESASTWPIVAARISRAGRPLDPFGLQVADTTRRADPSIAYGGSTYLIVWTDAEKLWVRRFSADGAAIDPSPIAVRTNHGEYSRPAVTWNGSAFFVVWLENGWIFDMFIAPDGTVSTARLIAIVSFLDGGPAVAWNGRIFLVIFGSYGPLPFEGRTRTGTGAVLVAADGTPIDPRPVIPGLIDTRADTVHGSVASNGRDFLVATDDAYDLSVIPVTSTHGTLTVGSRKILFRGFGGIQSDIGWNGSDYVVAWQYPAPSTAGLRPDEW